MIRIPDKQKDWSDWKGDLSKDRLNSIHNSIREMKECTNWDYVFRHVQMSENFIREFADEITDFKGWGFILERQELREKFIKEIKENIDWRWIPRYQKLSIPFILRYKEYLNWNDIFIYQKFTVDEWEQLKEVRKNLKYDSCLTGV